jgi:hypothetical protein
LVALLSGVEAGWAVVPVQPEDAESILALPWFRYPVHLASRLLLVGLNALVDFSEHLNTVETKISRL